MSDPQTDRDLVRLHWPVELRPAFDALFAIDDAMGEVVATASQPALAAIKLAWWRESLEKLDSGPPPGEPRLQGAAAELLPRGISGGDLSLLEQGWAALLDEAPDLEQVRERGALLFDLSARLLNVPHADTKKPGRLWAEMDAARRLSRPVPQSTPVPLRSDKALRPLTAFAALANRDARGGGPPFEPEATPGRAWTLLRHRITGR